ncbi:pentapeptide repeat-containing protein [Tenacibaculum salmonis]|uniref:pentapeptide repeat-containing protein n=1 Tax=Tenacibaculum sp. P3-BQ1 TaxID=3232310 RepID=UPI0034DFD36D
MNKEKGFEIFRNRNEQNRFIKYYLETDFEKISYIEIENLKTKYFIHPKGFWYDKNGIIDYDLITDFWILLRKFIVKPFNETKASLNFNGFVFPEFENNKTSVLSKKDYLFWGEDKGFIFEQKVSFYNCTFLGKVNFNNVEFLDEVNFSNSIFLSETTFRYSVFHKKVLFDSSVFQNKNKLEDYIGVDFSDAIFHNDAFFNYTLFERELRFSNCTFKKSFNFRNSIVHKQCFFGKATFIGEAHFHFTIFKEMTSFDYTSFESNTGFGYTIFADKVQFYSTKFIAVFFQKTFFLDIALFYRLELIECKELVFQDCYCFDKNIISHEKLISILNFIRFYISNFYRQKTNSNIFDFYKVISNKEKEQLKLYNHSILFSKEIKKALKIIKDSDFDVIIPNIKDGTFFSKKVQFQFLDVLFINTTFNRLDLTKTDFEESNVTNLQLKECDWGNSSRIILQKENNENKLDAKSIQSLEVLYRQIKRNYDNVKNWELSGKAFFSEMEMRRNRYFLERKLTGSGLVNFFNYIIFSIYKHSCNYTQNYVKPMFILLCCWLFVFPLLFGVIGCYSYQENYITIFSYSRIIYYDNSNLPYCLSFSNIYELSSSNTFLFIKTKITSYWFLTLIQKIVSTILLTFIILSFRKRFKQ